MTGTIRVVSKRSGGVKAAAGEVIIDADRKNPILGNRHVLSDHRDPEERAKVIHAHASLDLTPDILDGGPIFKALHAIAGRVQAGERIALACWCAPMPCHCDAYVKAVEHIMAGDDLQAIYRDAAGTKVVLSQPAKDQYDFGF
jgi:hypothetical protein